MTCGRWVGLELGTRQPFGFKNGGLTVFFYYTGYTEGLLYMQAYANSNTLSATIMLP